MSPLDYAHLCPLASEAGSAFPDRSSSGGFGRALPGHREVTNDSKENRFCRVAGLRGTAAPAVPRNRDYLISATGRRLRL